MPLVLVPVVDFVFICILMLGTAHEPTLVNTLAAMSPWCAKFTTHVPDKLVQWFKSGLALKSATSAVRTAYIQCMNATFNGTSVADKSARLGIALADSCSYKLYVS